MRILIDESFPRKLKWELVDHDVSTVPEMQWAGKKNGELLRLMASVFNVFITADQNLKYQQNLSTTSVAFIILMAPSNRLEDILPLMPAVREALTTIQPGQIFEIGGQPSTE